ncbi:MAG: hypothetical protein AVDCRST_MAG76-2180, partial [uncultured Acidimicrobiales bacterium]
WARTACGPAALHVPTGLLAPSPRRPVDEHRVSERLSRRRDVRRQEALRRARSPAAATDVQAKLSGARSGPLPSRCSESCWWPLGPERAEPGSLGHCVRTLVRYP